MSQALQDGRDDLGDFSSQQVAIRVVEPEKFEPDLTAYLPDPANDRISQLVGDIKDGASLNLSLECADGRRERIELTCAESKQWIESPIDERNAFANRKIRERRVNIAVAAIKRLRESGLQTTETLSPEEEACLREFNAIEEVTRPLASGGYEKAGRLREDFFGGGSGSASALYSAAPTQREYLPRGGPAGQQLQIGDVWDELAKAYYAWTHDPMGRQACELIADFVLGRGMSVAANDAKVQEILDEFNEREQINERLHTMAVSLSRDGELFLRKIPLGNGRTNVRTLPPETMWEIVTDAEDPMQVYWYVQRFQTRVVLYAPQLDAARTRWIERTISNKDVIHVKVNAKESDVRGRSDMYPALGWMKRLRSYFDAIVQKEYAAAAYQWHYKVTGGLPDIQNVANQIPGATADPGSSFVTNSLVDITAVSSAVRAVAGNGSTYEALVNHIAITFGLSKEYFGASSHANRASALVATEPAAKRFEERQSVISAFMRRLYSDVIEEARRYGLLDGVSDFGFQLNFPSIIKADSQARMTMLIQGESMGYWSKETAATQAAGEVEIDNYDFGDERKKTTEEIGVDPCKLIAQSAAMTKKGLPEPGDVAFDPKEVPNPTYAGTDAGDASPTSATGAAKIRSEIGGGGASSLESLAEAARTQGALVILP